MTKISKEELYKIARLSHMSLAEEEIPQLMQDIEGILTYAARVREVATTLHEPSHKNVNTMRDDKIVSTDPKPLLEKAPERIDDFFVVPMILESNE
jgi:aspartyl-tRNA(Asn)/glutamyl-tRNA(Gln) amidotransferase subunit C